MDNQINLKKIKKATEPPHLPYPLKDLVNQKRTKYQSI